MPKKIVPEVPQKTGKVGNTKQPSPAINWCFTLHNYTDSHISSIDSICKSEKLNYILEKETCPKTGNPHLQGYVFNPSKDKFRPFTVFHNELLNSIHWESCSTKQKNIQENNIRYCTKDARKSGDFSIVFSNFYERPRPLKILTEDQLWPWQKELLAISKTEPDERGIIWVYDPITCRGKTKFTKFMIEKQKCICFTGGSRDDIAQVLAMAIERGKDLNQITTMIFNFSMEQDKISYTALEQLKDGLITNTKYHSDTFNFNNPHLFVFSNFLPNCKSLNRKGVWNIKTINDANELVPYIEENTSIIEGERQPKGFTSKFKGDYV